jgi:hypothetical protein
MTILRMIWDETFGLFVDDGALALQVVVLIAALTASVKLVGVPPLLAAMLLIVGLLGILAVSLLRKVRGS